MTMIRVSQATLGSGRSRKRARASLSAGPAAAVLKGLKARGAAGEEILQRLAEAARLIALAESRSGFTHPSRRQRLRERLAQGRQLLQQALCDAERLLAEPEPPQPSRPPSTS